MKITHHSIVAIAYAQALLELATEQKQESAIGQELAALEGILEKEPNLGLYVADPAIGHAERTGLLNRVFKGRVSPLVFNFLNVMNLKGRLNVLKQAIETYQDLLDAQLGKIDVELTVVSALSSDELASVKRRISEALGKEALISQRVDVSILGGLVMHVDDKLLDASVRSQLKAIKEKMLAAKH